MYCLYERCNVLSILIPTLEKRIVVLKKLEEFLNYQIDNFGVRGEVEILKLCDSGQQTTGAKRNELINKASGKFCAFIDDDDWVSDTYIRDVTDVIRNVSEVDVIGFFGNVFFRGVYGGKMIHTTLCPNWTEYDKIYYRPPNHLNPVRTEIAKRYRFKNITVSEDFFWSGDLKGSDMVSTEVYLGHKPLYMYRCDSSVKQL